VAVTDVETACVVTVNVADELRAGIVTEAGTPAFVLLEDRETVTPPVGA